MKRLTTGSLRAAVALPAVAVAIGLATACGSGVEQGAGGHGAGGAGPGCDPLAPTSTCDDGNPCTVDACVQGACEHAQGSDGNSCSVGGSKGSCEAGQCLAGDCDPSDPEQTCGDDSPCTYAECDPATAGCRVFELNQPLPPDQQITGDCSAIDCINGWAWTIPDDLDVYDDQNPCTEDRCQAGMPVNDPLPDGTPCGAGGVCEQGSCVAAAP